MSNLAEDDAEGNTMSLPPPPNKKHVYQKPGDTKSVSHPMTQPRQKIYPNKSWTSPFRFGLCLFLLGKTISPKWHVVKSHLIYPLPLPSTPIPVSHKSQSWSFCSSHHSAVTLVLGMKTKNRYRQDNGSLPWQHPGLASFEVSSAGNNSRICEVKARWGTEQASWSREREREGEGS